MNKQLFDYFYFTRSERNGTLLLCILIVVSLVSPLIHQKWFVQTNSPSFVETTKPSHTPQNKPENNIASKVTISPSYFTFDPNTASKEDLLKLGISAKVSQTILNFRAKGGRFYQATDFQKIYGLSTKKYKLLKPYIQIQGRVETKKTIEKDDSIAKNSGGTGINKKQKLQLVPFDPNSASEQQLTSMGIPNQVVKTLLNYRNKGGQFYEKEDVAKVYGLSPVLYDSLVPYIKIETSYKKNVKSIAPIDINQATIEDWEQLPGIGHVLANRIMKFRNALGGFNTIDQISETYGITDSTFLSIKPHLTISLNLKTININEADLIALKAHPYLNYKQAKAIITYREQHGPYTSLQTLSRLPAIKPENLKKIIPYLRTN